MVGMQGERAKDSFPYGRAAGRRGGAASKMFSLAGESPVLAICPFQPSRYIRHTER